MYRTPDNQTLWRPRTWPKDLGVALATLLALALGWALMLASESRSVAFADPDSALRLSYPAGWNTVDSLLDLLVKVEDPATPSAFKTFFSLERRLLDPAAPPTLQELLDRRVEERSLLTGYHLLGEGETSVAGQRAIQLDYAYVVQPIDEPRRAALPVVVQARELIVVTADSSYYLSFAAPAEVFEGDLARFRQIVDSVEFP